MHSITITYSQNGGTTRAYISCTCGAFTQFHGIGVDPDAAERIERAHMADARGGTIPVMARDITLGTEIMDRGIPYRVETIVRVDRTNPHTRREFIAKSPFGTRIKIIAESWAKLPTVRKWVSVTR